MLLQDYTNLAAATSFQNTEVSRRVQRRSMSFSTPPTAIFVKAKLQHSSSSVVSQPPKFKLCRSITIQKPIPSASVFGVFLSLSPTSALVFAFFPQFSSYSQNYQTQARIRRPTSAATRQLLASQRFPLPFQTSFRLSLPLTALVKPKKYYNNPTLLLQQHPAPHHWPLTKTPPASHHSSISAL